MFSVTYRASYLDKIRQQFPVSFPAGQLTVLPKPLQAAELLALFLEQVDALKIIGVNYVLPLDDSEIHIGLASEKVIGRRKQIHLLSNSTLASSCTLQFNKIKVVREYMHWQRYGKRKCIPVSNEQAELSAVLEPIRKIFDANALPVGLHHFAAHRLV